MIKRLFVAVPVSKEVKDRIKPVYQQLKDTGADLNLVSIENLHFTVKFLGDVDESKIAGLKEKMNKAVQFVRKFPIRVRTVGVFPNLTYIKVIWIGVEDSQLTFLMSKINEELNYLRKNEHEEVPHLTLARVKTGKNKEKLPGFVSRFAQEDFGEMVVDKIVLYESRLTPEGPRYTLQGEWVLEEKNGPERTRK